MMKMFMKKYLKHIVLATLFVVCAVTTIWAINYDKSTTPLNNEITSGISGPINVPVQTVVNGVATVNSTVNGVSYGQTITVNAPLVAGQVFLHWFDGARNKILSYQESYNYRVLSTTPDLRAVYIAEGAMQVIFIDANENQIAVGVPTPNGGGFIVAAPAANLIPVRPGYAITGWSEDLNNIQLDLAGRAYVQAVYTRNSEEFPELLTVHIEDTLHGRFDFGKVTTVTTPETKGEEVFSHWTIDGRTVSYSRTYSFTVHRDTVLIPVYSETYEPVEISYLDPNYFEYDFGYNKQVTFVGRYELPWDWELVETGVLFYDGTLSGELTLETNNVRKVQSTNQNNNNEFTITTLNRTVFSPYHARSYLVFNDGFDYTVVYGELITIESPITNQELFTFESATKTGYATGNITDNDTIFELNDALLGTDAADRKLGLQSVRLRNGHITNITPFDNGVKSISFYYAKYGTDGNSTIKVQIAYNSLNPEFDDLATISVTSTTLTKVTINANFSNSALIRIVKTGTTRVNIDNLTINTLPDTEGPTFSGLSNKEVIIGSSFDPMNGVTAIDLVDGNVTSLIQVTGSVNTNIVGVYNLEYTVSDYSGNTTTQSISVEVVDISDSEKADIAANNLTKPAENTEYTEDFTLSVTSSYGSTVAWTSNSAAIVISGANAIVTRPNEVNASVRLTWTLILYEEQRTGYVDVIVKYLDVSIPEEVLEVFYNFGSANVTGYAAGDLTFTNTSTGYTGSVTLSKDRAQINTVLGSPAIILAPISTAKIAYVNFDFSSLDGSVTKIEFDISSWTASSLTNIKNLGTSKYELQKYNSTTSSWDVLTNSDGHSNLIGSIDVTQLTTVTYNVEGGTTYRVVVSTPSATSATNTQYAMVMDNFKVWTINP